MPYPRDPDPTDCRSVQAGDKLIRYLANDTDFISLYDGEIVRIDPLAIAPGEGLNTAGDMTVALQFGGESDEQVTLGLRHTGTKQEKYYFLFFVYTTLPRNEDAQRKLMNMTNVARRILRRYTMDTQATNDIPGLWNNMVFRDPASTYHVNSGSSRSITYGILFGTRYQLD